MTKPVLAVGGGHCHRLDMDSGALCRTLRVETAADFTDIRHVYLAKPTRRAPITVTNYYYLGQIRIRCKTKDGPIWGTKCIAPHQR